jgi:hypothetical protein
MKTCSTGGERQFCKFCKFCKFGKLGAFDSPPAAAHPRALRPAPPAAPAWPPMVQQIRRRGACIARITCRAAQHGALLAAGADVVRVDIARAAEGAAAVVLANRVILGAGVRAARVDATGRDGARKNDAYCDCCYAAAHSASNPRHRGYAVQQSNSAVSISPACQRAGLYPVAAAPQIRIIAAAGGRRGRRSPAAEEGPGGGGTRIQPSTSNVYPHHDRDHGSLGKAAHTPATPQAPLPAGRYRTAPAGVPCTCGLQGQRAWV